MGACSQGLLNSCYLHEHDLKLNGMVRVLVCLVFNSTPRIAHICCSGHPYAYTHSSTDRHSAHFLQLIERGLSLYVACGCAVSPATWRGVNEYRGIR